MGRLAGRLAAAGAVLVFLLFPCSSFSASSSEEREAQRIVTLKKELEREKRTLARLTEEKKFLEISGTKDSEALSELSEGIEVTSENIKFLEEELGSEEKTTSSLRSSRRSKKPSTDRNNGEGEDEKKAAAAWWDVYARSYEKF